MVLCSFFVTGPARNKKSGRIPVGYHFGVVNLPLWPRPTLSQHHCEPHHRMLGEMKRKAAEPAGGKAHGGKQASRSLGLEYVARMARSSADVRIERGPTPLQLIRVGAAGGVQSGNQTVCAGDRLRAMDTIPLF